MLEEELRATFTAAVDETPSPSDVAGRAIRSGRAQRRRRRALAGVATVVAVFGFAGGLLQVQDWRHVQGGGVSVNGLPDEDTESIVDFGPNVTSEPPPPQAEGPPPALDLVAKGQLWTSDGQKLKLGSAQGQAAVSPAYRLSVGWLVDDSGQLALVGSDGKQVQLAKADSWAVDATGARLAYVAQAHLYVAQLGKNGLNPVADAAVPAGTVAVTFVGTQIVLGARTDGVITAYDHWSTLEQYRPTWTDKVRAIYGTSGGALIGLAAGPKAGTACLAKLALDPTGFGVTQSGGCDLGLGAPEVRAALSADGRWLAVRRTVSVAFYDLTTFFTSEQSTAICLLPTAQVESQAAAQTMVRSRTAKTLAAAAPATGTPIWEQADSLLVADPSGAVRCRTDGTVERAALPDDTPASQLFNTTG